MAIVNRKKNTKTVKCQCHTSSSPNGKIYIPHKQARYSEILVVLYSEVRGITVYNIQCIQCT